MLQRKIKQHKGGVVPESEGAEVLFTMGEQTLPGAMYEPWGLSPRGHILLPTLLWLAGCSVSASAFIPHLPLSGPIKPSLEDYSRGPPLGPSAKLGSLGRLWGSLKQAPQIRNMQVKTATRHHECPSEWM